MKPAQYGYCTGIVFICEAKRSRIKLSYCKVIGMTGPEAAFTALSGIRLNEETALCRKRCILLFFFDIRILVITVSGN